MRTAIAFLALAVSLAAQTPRYPIQGSSGGGGGGATIASTTLLIKGDNAGNGIAAAGTDVCALLTLTGDVTSSAACATTIANAAVTAIKMVNAGVHTGDCTTTFPNCTITAGAITAAKMVNSGVFTGDATTTFPALTIGNAAITAVKMVNAGVFTGDAATTFPALTIGNGAITAVKMVNAGVMTGDVTTTFPAVTVAKVNGIAYSATAAAHSVEVITIANTTATAKVIPDCTDTTGNHLNYAQSTDAFSCGTTASGAILGANTFTDTQTITQATATHAILASTGGSNTGSDATSAFSLAWTLNTSGSPDVFKLAVTDTARGSSTKLLNIYGGASGTTSEFSIDRSGNGAFTGNVSGGGLNLGSGGPTGCSVASAICTTAAGTVYLAFGAASSPQFKFVANNAGSVSSTVGEIDFSNGSSLTGTSSTQDWMRSAITFAPTSGTALFAGFHILPTVNQTGGANGTTRGIYIDNTITAAADYRGLEVANVGSTMTAVKTGTGIVQFGVLTTTGAATGKTVVCVDTSTGILYASTSGSSCAN